MDLVSPAAAESPLPKGITPSCPCAGCCLPRPMADAGPVWQPDMHGSGRHTMAQQVHMVAELGPRQDLI